LVKALLGGRLVRWYGIQQVTCIPNSHRIPFFAPRSGHIPLFRTQDFIQFDGPDDRMAERKLLQELMDKTAFFVEGLADSIEQLV
jgi:hypothetical protein